MTFIEGGNTMRVIVDADACPVKDIIIEQTTNKQIPVILVSSFAHFSNQVHPKHVSSIYVEHGADAADFKIVQLVEPGDLIVTQDYGLASLLLSKDCRIIHHTGFEYTAANIEHLLQTRYYSAMARKSGQRIKGPSALREEEKLKFKKLFSEII